MTVTERDLNPTHGGMTAERCAVVLAHTRHFAPRHRTELLSRLALSPANWSHALTCWGRELTRGLAVEDPDTIVMFARAYATARKRLRETQPRLAAIGPLTVVPSEQVPAPPPVPRSAQPTLPPRAVVSSLPPPTSPPSRAPSSQPASSAASPWAPPAQQADDPLNATVGVGVVLARPALPFVAVGGARSDR